MVNFYVMRINNEEMTVEQVPKLWRKNVETKLRQLD